MSPCDQAVWYLPVDFNEEDQPDIAPRRWWLGHGQGTIKVKTPLVVPGLWTRHLTLTTSVN
jgi:hypothetical protein